LPSTPRRESPPPKQMTSPPRQMLSLDDRSPLHQDVPTEITNEHSVTTHAIVHHQHDQQDSQHTPSPLDQSQVPPSPGVTSTPTLHSNLNSAQTESRESKPTQQQG
jgi:hypothetical protein